MAQPDPLPLLTLVCESLSDAEISRIAHADYGWQAQKNERGLRAWLRHRDLSIRPEVNAEVLRLVRFSGPEDPDWVGHNTRLFCCALLVGTFPRDEGDHDTLVQLGVSAFALGREHVQAARGLLAWRGQRVPGPGVELLQLLLAVLAGDPPAAMPPLRLPQGKGLYDARWGWLVRKAQRELPEDAPLRADLVLLERGALL